MLAGDFTTDREDWAYPEVWEACVGAWAPCLGVQGLTLFDQSGYGRNGTLTNFTLSSAWPVDSGITALQPSTGTGIVSVPFGSIPISGVFSLKIWYYLDAGISTFGYKGLFNDNVTDALYRVNGFNYPYFKGTTYSDLVMADSNWNCIIVTRDAANAISLWKNGVKSAISPTLSTTITFTHFSSTANSGEKWPGLFDDAALWTRLMPPSEIAWHYAIGRGGMYTPADDDVWYPSSALISSRYPAIQRGVCL